MPSASHAALRTLPLWLPGYAATRMHHDAAANGRPPTSGSGGTSGSASRRSRVVTPSIRILPAAASGAAGGIGLNMKAMWPPARSLMAGDMPL